MTAQVSHSTLHIEVRLKSVDEAQYIRPDLICDGVADWLSSNFSKLKMNQHITEFESLDHANVVDIIKVVDHSGSPLGKESSNQNIYDLDSVRLDIQAYELRDSEADLPASAEQAQGGLEEEAPQLRVTLLPNRALDGVWGALVFETDIPARLLRFLTRMMALSRNPKLDMNILNWNRLMLLHGPPGTGKTSLCMALAQKLSIRLGRHFTQGKLVEISTQSLHSKWFGQSGKLVSKMFDEIHSLAEDEESLICVLIDEVESLTSSRERSAQSNECNDAMRATNQLLTGLDRLRLRSNILVFGTSNLLTAIDAAFLDRADIKQLIPPPGPPAIYEILRSTLNELIRCDAIQAPEHPPGDTIMDDDDDATGTPSSPSPSSTWTLLPPQTLPKLEEVRLNLYGEEDGPGGKLWAIAQNCQGLSGRTLRRLPFSAIALYTYTETCELGEALAALDMVVVEEQQGRGAGALSLVS